VLWPLCLRIVVFCSTAIVGHCRSHHFKTNGQLVSSESWHKVTSTSVDLFCAGILLVAILSLGGEWQATR